MKKSLLIALFLGALPSADPCGARSTPRRSRSGPCRVTSSSSRGFTLRPGASTRRCWMRFHRSSGPRHYRGWPGATTCRDISRPPSSPSNGPPCWHPPVTSPGSFSWLPWRTTVVPRRRKLGLPVWTAKDQQPWPRNSVRIPRPTSCSCTATLVRQHPPRSRHRIASAASEPASPSAAL